MKPIVIVLVIVLAVLQYKLWFARDSLLEVFHLKQTIALQESKIAEIKENNAALAVDIENLKKGGGAIETRARTDLGMVKSGEVFYQVVR